MAFKTFAPGVLTSSDVNTFLMRQAVITCTSSTRPSSPSEGMVIYETDTGYYRYYTGSAWEITSVPGAWTSVTPTWTNLTIGNGTTGAAWSRVNSTIFYVGYAVLGSTSSVSTDPQVSIPFVTPTRPISTASVPYGRAVFSDDSAGISYIGRLSRAGSASRLLFLTTQVDATYGYEKTVSASVPFAFTTNDSIQWAVTYETSDA